MAACNVHLSILCMTKGYKRNLEGLLAQFTLFLLWKPRCVDLKTFRRVRAMCIAALVVTLLSYTLRLSEEKNHTCPPLAVARSWIQPELYLSPTYNACRYLLCIRKRDGSRSFKGVTIVNAKRKVGRRSSLQRCAAQCEAQCACIQGAVYARLMCIASEKEVRVQLAHRRPCPGLAMHHAPTCTCVPEKTNGALDVRLCDVGKAWSTK